MKDSSSPSEHLSRPLAQLPADGFLRLRQVLQLIPVSRSVWWDGVRDGRFPKGVKLSARTTAWRVQDIAELIEQLGAKRKR